MFSDDLAAMLKEEKQFRIYEGNHSFSGVHDILSSMQIDLVIARVDGIHSLQRVSRIIRSGTGQKVIITGVRDTDIIMEHIRAGVKGRLDSSITPALLRKAIKVVHKGEVWFDRETSSRVLELLTVHAAEKRQHRKIDLLSVREKEVLECVSRGLKNREIADSLFISEITVKTHLYNIYDKLGVRNRHAAALMMRKR
jgi:DNA-binding NarL/FixJ family response regulator